MKSIYWISVLVLLASFAGVQAKDGAEFNGGFEKADPAHPEYPAGWAHWDFGNAGIFERTQAEAHSGTHSVAIRGECIDGCWFSSPIKVIPGHFYRLSCWVKRTRAEDAVFLWLCGYDHEVLVSGSDLELLLSDQHIADKGPCGRWNLISETICIPYNIDSISIRCHLRGNGTAWFDDISLALMDEGSLSCVVDPNSVWTGTLEHARQGVGLRLINGDNARRTLSVTVSSSELGDSRSIEDSLEPLGSKKIYVGLDNQKHLPIGSPIRFVISIRSGDRTINEILAAQVAAAPTSETLQRTSLIPHFHGDPWWGKNQNYYLSLCQDITHAMLQIMRRDPDYNCVLSELQYLAPYYVFHPEDRAGLKAYFASGRAEGAGSYNQPQECESSLEYLIRNFLYGKLFHEDVLDGKAEVSMQLDNFGQIIQLPQILAKSGFNGIIAGRVNPSDATTWKAVPLLIDCMAPDGSRIAQYRQLYDRYNILRFPVSDGRKPFLSDNIGRLPKGYENLTLAMLGSDWNYPDRSQAAYARESRMGAGNSDLLSPTAVVGGPGTYFNWVDAQRKQQPDNPLPLVSRDMSAYSMGISVTYPDLNIGDRLAENKLVEAEKWATVANILGYAYPDSKLDKAWREVLLSQDHGSRASTDSVTYTVFNCVHDALEIGHNAVEQALGHIGTNIQTAPGDKIPLVVYNSLSWERDDVCKADIVFPEGRPFTAFELHDSAGKVVPCDLLESQYDSQGGLTHARLSFVAGRIPSVGYQTYYLVPVPNNGAASAKEVEQTTIENEFYRLNVDPARGGAMVSLYDKAAKRELLGGPKPSLGNEIIGLLEYWNTVFEIHTSNAMAMHSGESHAAVHCLKGDSFETLVIDGLIGTTKTKQTITLYPGIKRIDFKTVLDWPPNPDCLYLVSFPSKIAGATGVFDEKVGAIARDPSPMNFAYWEPAFADSAVYASNQWLEKGWSVLFSFVDCNGLEQASFAPGQSEIRFAQNSIESRRLSDRLQQALVRRGITCTPAFDTENVTSDLKFRQTRIYMGLTNQPGLYKDLLESQSAGTREVYNQQVAAQGYGFLFLNDPNAAPKFKSRILLIGAENDAGLGLAVDRFADDLSKDAIVRLPSQSDRCLNGARVDRYGLALLNIGCAGCSLENNGTLCQLLTFSPDFYARELKNFHIIPENKRQVFQYALYPHAGSWREARTARAGWEFNVQLLARQATAGQKGSLPENQSFLHIDGDQNNLILSAFKPRTNGPAAYMKKTSDVRDGLIIRVFETDGRTSTAAHLTIFKPIHSVTPATMIERPNGPAINSVGGSFEMKIGGNAIETWLGNLDNIAPLAPLTESQQKLEMSPRFARYWLQNDGEAPEGYNHLAPVLEGQIKQGQTSTVSAWVVNSYRDQSVAGKAELSAPRGWTVEPNAFDYYLAPGASARHEIRVTVPAQGADGWLRLRTVNKTIMLEDVLKAGSPQTIQTLYEIKDNNYVVILTNPNNQEINGTITVSTPIETWGQRLSGDFTQGSLTPWQQSFHLSANAAQTYNFKMIIDGHADAAAFCRDFWAIFKISHDGENIYFAASKPSPEDKYSYDTLVKAGVHLEKFFTWKAKTLILANLYRIGDGQYQNICSGQSQEQGVEYQFLKPWPRSDRLRFAIRPIMGAGDIRLIQPPDPLRPWQSLLVAVRDATGQGPRPPFAFELYYYEEK